MRRNKFIKITAIVILSIFVLASCGLPPPGTALTPEEREAAKNNCIAQYTIGGAIIGGIAGALIGGGKRAGVGTAIGAAGGGMLGYLIAYGKCVAYFSDLQTFPMAGYQDTMKNERYSPEQGEVVKIKEFSSNPQEVNLGNKVQLKGSYYIMAPKDIKEVKVKETRTLYYFNSSKKEWVELGPAENEVTASLGTRKADGTIDIAKDLPEGRYRVDFKVSALGKEDVASTEYLVKKATAMERLIKTVAVKIGVMAGD
ncbi:MAG: hypothetical protein ACK415_06240 [Thermodesulfovibrionales bacterium]